MDVTAPLAFAHEHNISFNLVMAYLCNRAADSIINYRYRFIDEKPFIIDHNRPLVNHLKKGEEIFVIGEGPWPSDDIVEFCKDHHERKTAGSRTETETADEKDKTNKSIKAYKFVKGSRI